MAKEIIAPDTVFNSIPRHLYSQAIKVGNTIYISGQTAWDKEGKVVGRGDFEAQMRQVLENMKLILEAAGASMSDVVELGVFLKDERYLRRDEAFGKVLRQYFGDYCPTSTAVQISNLFHPDLLVEIKAIAVVE